MARRPRRRPPGSTPGRLGFSPCGRVTRSRYGGVHGASSVDLLRSMPVVRRPRSWLMSSIADRTESGSYAGLVVTAGSLYLLPMVIPAPRPFFLILGGFGFFLTMAYGVSPVYKIFGGLMLGLAVAGYLVNLAEPRPDPHDFLSPQDRAIDAATIDRTLSEPV